MIASKAVAVEIFWYLEVMGSPLLNLMREICGFGFSSPAPKEFGLEYTPAFFGRSSGFSGSAAAGDWFKTADNDRSPARQSDPSRRLASFRVRHLSAIR